MGVGGRPGGSSRSASQTGNGSGSAAMTTSQVTSRDGAVFTRFGNHDLPVPGPLGTILTELIRTGRSHTGTGSPASTPWLFPGAPPGRPMTPARLGERLRAMGIQFRGRAADQGDLRDPRALDVRVHRRRLHQVAEELAEAAADTIAAFIPRRGRSTADGATTVPHGGRNDR